MADLVSKRIQRTEAELEINEFLSNNKKSGLVYLRGRRRVGKTTLLKKVQSESSNTFYFIGMLDESNRNSLGRFVVAWDTFTGITALSRYKKTELSWSLCFDEITQFAKKNRKAVLGIIFDEIQWIAKIRSGFVGALKDKWIDWEKAGNIKLIICGSSNKFFIENVGGEEKILRGLKTSSDIVLSPLTADEVRSFYFPRWSVDEVLLIYMMLGGVPYYLNQIEREHGCIRALNDALFTKKTIFLSEVDEVLNVEFNKGGLLTAKKILSSLGVQGGTFTQASDQIKMSQSALFESLHKLVDYSLLKEKSLRPSTSKKISRNNSGVVYFYNDPYLLFYFACLEKMKVSIEENSSQLLICNLVGSQSSLYIPNFTGRAFEIFIRNLLLAPSSKQQKKLLSLIGVSDRDFDLYDSLFNEHSGDFVLVHRKLRTQYVLECKWTNSLELVKEGVAQLLNYQAENILDRVERVLITNCKVRASIVEKEKARGVSIVCVEDLFAQA